VQKDCFVKYCSASVGKAGCEIAHYEPITKLWQILVFDAEVAFYHSKKYFC